MGDVTMAVISCTCVFMAVFVPVTFMGGTSGIFYTAIRCDNGDLRRSFHDLCIDTLPCFVCHDDAPERWNKSAKSINGRVRAAYNASFNAVLGKYKKGVMFFIITVGWYGSD